MDFFGLYSGNALSGADADEFEFERSLKAQHLPFLMLPGPKNCQHPIHIFKNALPGTDSKECGGSSGSFRALSLNTAEQHSESSSIIDFAPRIVHYHF